MPHNTVLYMYIAKSKLLHVSRLLARNLELKVILTFELSLYEYKILSEFSFLLEDHGKCVPHFNGNFNKL